mmetsp:Transcript_3630/g.8218  ORF Transcript_3630/g.8218 Transcript_3630/m.8218 type:complete len:342 (-) Transcript_3630:382-1407(-)
MLTLSPSFNGTAMGSALAGGLLCGCTVVFKTSVMGGVLGISNYTKRIFVQPESSRRLFIFGLIAAGRLGSMCLGLVEPPALPLTGAQALRILVGTLLTGGGANIQCGCTSGHGLTGLARLSIRSLVSVPLFMASGCLTATLLGTQAAFPSQAAVEAAMPAASTVAAISAAVVAVLAGIAGVLKCKGKSVEEKASYPLLYNAGELVSGSSFGLGLALSGMSRPSKVASFLDLSAPWDGSLMFVMGGALLMTLPYFQFVQKKQEKPILGKSFDLPALTGIIDKKLVLGALIFGCGWGTGGMCPGPIWVNAGAALTPEALLALAGLAGGVVAADRLVVPMINKL